MFLLDRWDRDGDVVGLDRHDKFDGLATIVSLCGRTHTRQLLTNTTACTKTNTETRLVASTHDTATLQFAVLAWPELAKLAVMIERGDRKTGKRIGVRPSR
jgi:hypothetical protein